MQEKTIIKKIEELNNISRIRWLNEFPEFFPDKIWNGHQQREESLLLKQLKEIENKNPKTFWRCVKKSNTKKYYCTSNVHDGQWGLDDQDTPQGGGVIAQASTKEACLKEAVEVHGINLIFISY